VSYSALGSGKAQLHFRKFAKFARPYLLPAQSGKRSFLVTFLTSFYSIMLCRGGWRQQFGYLSVEIFPRGFFDSFLPRCCLSFPALDSTEEFCILYLLFGCYDMLFRASLFRVVCCKDSSIVLLYNKSALLQVTGNPTNSRDLPVMSSIVRQFMSSFRAFRKLSKDKKIFSWLFKRKRFDEVFPVASRSSTFPFRHLINRSRGYWVQIAPSGHSSLMDMSHTRPVQ
jgi:hypothetical protein